MPANKKLFIHGQVYELCFRTEEGLPFVATPFIIGIWESILARAQSKHPVKIIAGVLMANHAHIIVQAIDPQDVPRFVGYLKKETSHVINRLLGRRQRTVWKRGYDSPLLGDPEKVLERLVYCYTNPQLADLEDTIDDYPNWSTWDAFLEAGSKKLVHRIARDDISPLPGRTLSLEEQEELAEKLQSLHVETCELCIEPDAWIEAFPELENATPEEQREMIIERVRQAEESIRKSRKGTVRGALNLVLESPRKPHTPKKHGRRMLCMFSDIEARSGYIRWYREVIRELQDLIQEAGSYLISRPPGLFSPGGRLCSNLIVKLGDCTA